MESKPNFDKAESLARELRLIQQKNSFSLNIKKMEFDRDVCIDTFENYAAITNCSVSELTGNNQLKDGYTIKRGNSNIILYKGTDIFEPRLNWTLAHELGHIYMGHTKDEANEEVEAHWFASELLMPTPLIYELVNRGIRVSNFTLVDLFSVSYNAAYKKINSLNRMPIKLLYLYNELIEKYSDEIYKCIAGGIDRFEIV